jgi:conserved oligomeric Golgi complex subunit 3
MHPSEPINTAQAFYDWSTLVDRAVAHEQEAEFRVRLTEVSDRLGECDKLVDHLDIVNEEVESMLAEWRSVEASGESLKGACERLLAERVSDHSCGISKS